MSGRKALTALGTTAGQNAYAARGLHALAEAVAALAHEAAWLIRTFHVRLRALSAVAPVSLQARKKNAHTAAAWTRPKITFMHGQKTGVWPENPPHIIAMIIEESRV